MNGIDPMMVSIEGKPDQVSDRVLIGMGGLYGVIVLGLLARRRRRGVAARERGSGGTVDCLVGPTGPSSARRRRNSRRSVYRLEGL